MVDKPSNKLSVVLEIKSLRSHTSDGRQKIGLPICFSVNTHNCMCIVVVRGISQKGKWPLYDFEAVTD